MMIQGLKPRFHEAGKIKLGITGAEITSRGGKKFRPPRKLEHFLVTSCERGADGNFKLDPIMQDLGDTPTEIPVRLLFDSIEENFWNSYSVFIGGKCICCGDGVTAERKQTQQTSAGLRLTGEVKTVDCGDACEYFKYRSGEPAKKFGAGTCRPYAILRVTLEDAQEVGGIYLLRTTSLNTIQSIRTSLAYIQMQAGGILSGLPLKLVFTKRQATTADGMKTTIPVVNIVFAGSMQQLRDKALETAKLRSASQLEMGQVRKSLQLITMKDTVDDEVEINAEFHPESVNVQVIDETPRANATPEEVAAEAERFGEALPADAWDKRGDETPMNPEEISQTKAEQTGVSAIAQGVPSGAPTATEVLASRNAQAAEILSSPGLDEATPPAAEVVDKETGEVMDGDGLSEGEQKFAAEGEKPAAASGMDW